MLKLFDTLKVMTSEVEMMYFNFSLSLNMTLSSLKEVNILAIILVPLIMTLSRGHTGQIKRAVIMR